MDFYDGMSFIWVLGGLFFVIQGDKEGILYMFLCFIVSYLISIQHHLKEIAETLAK